MRMASSVAESGVRHIVQGETYLNRLVHGLSLGLLFIWQRGDLDHFYYEISGHFQILDHVRHSNPLRRLKALNILLFASRKYVLLIARCNYCFFKIRINKKTF